MDLRLLFVDGVLWISRPPASREAVTRVRSMRVEGKIDGEEEHETKRGGAAESVAEAGDKTRDA